MSHLNFFRKILYACDQFGKPINLLVKKNNIYHTPIGAFVSMGIIAFTLFSTYSLVLDLFNQTSPNIVSILEFTTDPKVIIQLIFDSYMSLHLVISGPH
jgi:hypothetical protein